MPKHTPKSVLVDTSFLITLYDDRRPNHAIAKQYFKYFLDNDITLFLSSVVIAEFNQVQPIAKLLASGNFIPLPFNVDDAIRTGDIVFQMGDIQRRRGSGNPKYADDIKLIAQADLKNIDFIITEDGSTLAHYCEALNSGSIIKTKAIKLVDGYDESYFNEGQTSLGV